MAFGPPCAIPRPRVTQEFAIGGAIAAEEQDALLGGVIYHPRAFPRGRCADRLSRQHSVTRWALEGSRGRGWRARDALSCLLTSAGCKHEKKHGCQPPHVGVTRRDRCQLRLVRASVWRGLI